jgi:hypothetical protein
MVIVVRSETDERVFGARTRFPTETNPVAAKDHEIHSVAREHAEAADKRDKRVELFRPDTPL